LYLEEVLNQILEELIGMIPKLWLITTGGEKNFIISLFKKISLVEELHVMIAENYLLLHREVLAVNQ
jgi:hypothetical protein